MMALHAVWPECEKSMQLTASSIRSWFFCCNCESSGEAAQSEAVPTVARKRSHRGCRTLCPSMAHGSSDGTVGCIVQPQIIASRKNPGMPLNIWCVCKLQSLDGFTGEKAKALTIGLAKLPALYRIAVGRNLESWWRYEGGPMLRPLERS